MSLTPKELEAAALSLSRTERADLARLLIDSLDEDDEVSEAWRAEARRRVQSYRDGSAQTFDAEEVLTAARERFKR